MNRSIHFCLIFFFVAGINVLFAQDIDLSSYSVGQVPNPAQDGVGYVADPTNILDEASVQELNRLISAIESKTSAEIAIAILPSIGEEVPKNFAVKLFETWEIGKAKTDNGLLILTVMDQRRTEFEVGYGLEPILTDALCYRIGSQEIVPYFKRGEYGAGLISALIRIQSILDNPEVVDEIYDSGLDHSASLYEKYPIPFYILFGYGFICLMLALWYYGVMFDIQRSKDDYFDKYKRLEKMKVGCLLFMFPLPFLFYNMLVKKRLKKYRYAPRFSRINGMPLFLKDELADNDFLERSQVLEETLESVNYDVWVTEDESDILVLEYEGAISKYDDCRKCGYKTFGRTKSVVAIAATFDQSGERHVFYECRNCNYKETKIEAIAQLMAASSSSSGSSSFGGGSSGGSSSFGGGSSGGGGAGVSW